MKWIWTLFVICFFHQFTLRKCESAEDIRNDTTIEDEKHQEEQSKHQEELVNDEAAGDWTMEALQHDEGQEEKYNTNKEKSNTNDEKLNTNKEKLKKKKNRNALDDLDQEQYEIEKLAGDPADTFGTNQHHYYPTEYKDFGRRFVLQYPYEDKVVVNEAVAESVLDNVAKNSKKHFTKEDLKLLPVKASPDLVLRVALQSAMEQANHPQNELPIKMKDILRTGDYWDSVWKEEVDPKTVLRSFQERTGYNLEDEKQGRMIKLNSLKAKIMPGSKLYQLVSVLKRASPRLLYVINDNKFRD